ncbi:NmrA/HSCARG family protein [Gramella sp. GC03-9]|uniref:NmrA/HSCARG family protein n=1 Tax=Christiangramia oceanisediminis TaxID=2920386 RepID=A0A9X2I2V9_9FLAO|nr:NmrA/HSCARG family protein [Gramella oceanisediminis]MCP9199685.1 NmrA/HSCARG family protein [Gramella oceanisediminis]
MNDPKIIVVVGATGSQGSGLVKAIIEDPDKTFEVRAITRDYTSDKAQELRKHGADLFEADVDDKESLIEAFEGAYGAFCVTFFWEHFSPEKEKEHARNMAEAAKEAKLKHVIWSSLEDTRKWIPVDDDRMPTLMGHYKVPHYDAKGEADSYFIKSKVPYTLLRTSFFWDNFINFGMGPQKDENGRLSLNLPMSDKKLPGIASEDIGKTAFQIFKKGNKYKGKTISIAGGLLTGNEMAAIFSEVLGKKVKYHALEPDLYRNSDFPGADDLGNMFQFKAEFEKEYCALRDPENTWELNPELLSFKEWLEKNKNRFRV